MFGKWLTDRNNIPNNNRKLDRKVSAPVKGALIEQQAQQWLILQGLTFIESNYPCRLGEIDLIMLDRQQLVFIEVRYRQRSHFGSAAESVNWRKQQKLLKTATHYLAHRRQYSKLACRFDVLAVQPGNGNDGLYWNWIRNAFTG